jgi:hypothetical protein
MEHLWHKGTFTDVFFVLTFMCGKFYLISRWNQFKSEVTQDLTQIGLKLRPQTSVASSLCPARFLFRNQFLLLLAHFLDGSASCPVYNLEQ